jgi:uncharacterized protein (DUF1330 family)
MALTLCVLLWPHPGEEEALTAYEDEVLALLGDHGARVLTRVRRTDDAGDGPLEVQVIELPGEEALDAYLADPRRLASADVRDRAIARTQMFPVSDRRPPAASSP